MLDKVENLKGMNILDRMVLFWAVPLLILAARGTRMCICGNHSSHLVWCHPCIFSTSFLKLLHLQCYRCCECQFKMDHMSCSGLVGSAFFPPGLQACHLVSWFLTLSYKVTQWIRKSDWMYSKSAMNLVRNGLVFGLILAMSIDKVNMHSQCWSLLEVSHLCCHHGLLGQAHLAWPMNFDFMRCQNCYLTSLSTKLWESSFDISESP